MDSDIINIVVVAAVIYFAVKYFTRDTPEADGQPNINSLLGFRAKKATPQMVDTVHNAFPNIPRENIHYDLLRSGSVEQTVNKLLERGFLEPPSAGYWRAFPRPEQDNAQGTTGTNTAARNTAGTTATKAAPTLLERFGLQSHSQPAKTTEWDGTGPIPYSAKGKGREEPIAEATSTTFSPTKWEATPEKRQAHLHNRKQAMILAARQRLLEKEAAESAEKSGATIA